MLLLRVVLAGLGGIGAGVAFEPLALGYLLPVAVAVVTLCCRGLRPGPGFLVGAVFGTAFMLVLLPWLQVIGVDAWIALSLVQGLFYGLLGAGTVSVLRLPGWPVWVAALWVAAELLRARLPFGGFPWGKLAFATADTPVAPLVAYVGTAGVTFAVALLGTALAWAALTVRRTPVRAVAAVLGAVLVASLGSAFPPNTPPPNEDRPVVTVAAVQGDVPGEGMDAFSERRAVLENHVRATLELAEDIDAGSVPRPDFVVWPENSTDIDPFQDPTVHADIQAAVDAVGVPVLVGAMVDGGEPSDVYNQGIVWHPGSGPGERYSKRHPVPFGEYIPLRDVLAPYIERLDQIPRDMVPGTRTGALEIGGITIGDLICFEVAYDDLVRDVVDSGAGLLVVQTNNATYMGTGQVEQQFAISRLRALETNRHVVVAATNGVTGVVAPDGSVVERLPVRTRGVIVESFNLGGPSAGVRLGAAIELLISALGVGAVVAGILLRRRGRRSTPTPRQDRVETLVAEG